VPSDIPIAGTDQVIPAASVETIQEVVEAFGQAARRAAEAGFDCIEFHAAHNYSPHAFLSPAFNKRQDEYGGSFENRARYLLECIRSIRKNIPDDMPLFMRIDAHDDYLENGLTIEDVIRFCLMAKEEGVDVLDISRGNISSAAIKYEVPPVDIPRGFNVENAARIKRETQMITIAVGRINDPAQADEIIASGKADMVVMGRAQLADPEFCNKAYRGDVDSIVRCIGCNQGCFDGFVSPDMPHITCLRNPALGREAEFALKQAEHPKTVVIAGGGMAGMEAAITLKQRGHEPILCEKSSELGGQFLLAGLAPRKKEMRDAAISRAQQTIKVGVDVRMNTEVDADLIKKISPDVVIIATGAKAAGFNIPGIDKPNVYSAYDVLSDRVDIHGDVIVVGGGLVGLEVAEYLAERKNNVTVIEALEGIGRDLGMFRKICVMESLYCYNIATMDKSRCIEIKDNALVIEKEGQLQELKCDYIVIAIGSQPVDYSEIENYCKKNRIPFYIIGDAAKPRRAIDAIEEAAEVARKV